MCGRVGSWSSPTELAQAYHALAAPDALEVPASWNRAPGSELRVVVERLEQARPDRRQPDPDGDPAVRRELRAARWGLLPRWARSPREGQRAFNARSETVAERPTFRQALRSFRVLVPVDCWYEWRPDPTAPRGARPYAVTSAHGGPLALAGLASWWRAPSLPFEDPDPALVRPGPALHVGRTGDGASWLLTATVLTRPASPELAWLHEREPVVLAGSVLADWLDPRRTRAATALALLEAPRPALAWHEVGPQVGSTRVDGPSLADPLPGA